MAEASKRRVAVNAGGGDAPGLNAVVRALALSAERRGWEVYGIRHGYRGLIEDEPDGIFRLDAQAVRGITHLGGTILGSTNRGDPFRYPVLKDGELVPIDVSRRVVTRFAELGFEALVALGGDGSLGLALQLMEIGLPRVIGVPKTIDNDLPATDITFGFETAVAAATEALDRLHPTTEAHERVMVVEVMGRDAGWIALHAGLAGGADVILIPEIPFQLESVCAKVRARDRLGRGFSIVVVAEGARPVGGAESYREGSNPFSDHARLGGVGEALARQIEHATGKTTRCVVLGHLQRGGTPVAADRLLSLQLGTAAARFVDETADSGLISVRDGRFLLVPLQEIAGPVRRVGLDSGVLSTGRDLGVCFGDEPPHVFT